MKTYTRKELSQKYNIPRSQWDQKHDDLLDHLQDFMDIKEIKSERGDRNDDGYRNSSVDKAQKYL